MHARVKTPRLITAVLLGTVVLGLPLSAADWPQWRGPSNSGASPETSLPLKWSNTENIAWKAPLTGVGVSSPIVWGERVFVTSQIGAGASRLGPRLGQGADATPAERALGRGPSQQSQQGGGPVRFAIEALSASDGRRLWSYELPAQGTLPSVHDKHNLASASPVTDGERVYAIFGTGQVSAVDMAGKAAWTRHLGQDFGVFDINWGHGSSPVLYRKHPHPGVLPPERVVSHRARYAHGKAGVEGRSSTRRAVLQHAPRGADATGRRTRRELERWG